MRLFHVSEKAGITGFYPWIATRADLDKNQPLVWAIDEAYLPKSCLPCCGGYHAREQGTVKGKGA